MTQEEKAKAYDEAYKKVAIRFGSNVADEIFPELKESKDERIKREILDLVSIAGNGNQFEEIKDWLEKQGEQNFNHTLDIEIPFGADDSELQEASYHIPKGFHAKIEDDKVVIKRTKGVINKSKK